VGINSEIRNRQKTHRFINLAGETFGKLVVLRRGENTRSRNTTWVCKCECGNECVVASGHLRAETGTRSCGCLVSERVSNNNKLRNQVGAENPSWKGGRYVSKDGYVIIWTAKNEYRKEHHVVMEKHLGRRLLPHETVHHKNGVRNDNRHRNLELWSSSHPPGQRVVDKVKWAREILKQYGEFDDVQ
jgi:hypothetical protein